MTQKVDQDGQEVRYRVHLVPQINQKHIHRCNDFHRTSTEYWQKTQDSQKGKKISI